MNIRAFRRPESYAAERVTRDMLTDFLRGRGFQDVRQDRRRHGQTESQTIHATTPDGELLAMRVRLCWHHIREETYSATQLLHKVRNNDWVGTLQEKVERERSEGTTHFLVVQREADRIIYAALIPLSELVAIWCAQRDTSESLIAAGRLGRRRKNHAMNGSSPTLWLQDDRAPEVAAALWEHAGVRDLASLENLQSPYGNDTFDDLPPSIDYLLLGSDGGLRTRRVKSYVKRDRRVRAAVLQRAQGKCERYGCGATRDYPGFLDVHHILGAERSDRYWNCVAICPNCHREAHMAPERNEINASLLVVAVREQSNQSQVR